MGTGNSQPVDLRPLQPNPIPRGSVQPGTASGDAVFRKIVFQKIVQDLTTASIGGGATSVNGVRADVKGTGLILSLSVGGSGVIEVQHNGEGDFIPYTQGTSFNPAPFEFLNLRWNAQAGITVTLTYWTDSPSNPIE